MGRERTCAGPECAREEARPPRNPRSLRLPPGLSPLLTGGLRLLPIQSRPGPADANTARRAGSAPGLLDARGTREPREGLGTSARRRAGGLPSASAACSGRLKANAMDARRFQASVQWGFCRGDSGKGQGGRRVEP